KSREGSGDRGGSRGNQNHVACAAAPPLIKVVSRTACNHCLRAWEPTDRAIVFANRQGRADTGCGDGDEMVFATADLVSRTLVRTGRLLNRYQVSSPLQ